MTFTARPHRTPGWPLAMLLVMTCMILPAISATAAEAAPARHAYHSAHSRSHRALANAARIVPRALNAAAERSRQADRTLVSDARGLKRCLRYNQRHPKRCNAARRAVQRAGTRLARAKRRLATLARRTGTNGGRAGKSASPNPRQAPVLTVSGLTLSWTRVAGLNNYVLASKLPGEAATYSVVKGTSITPPPVPGVTVDYSVRTTTDGSAWSAEEPIAYAAATGTDTQAAPALSVSGRTLTWTAIPTVGTYILATNVPGKALQYTVVSGTSTTPPSVPGVKVGYTIRTAVDGSTWSQEVTIAYPASAPAAAEKPSGSSGSGQFEMGIVSGSDALYELPFIQQLGAHTARIYWTIGTPVSQMEATIAAFARAGVRPLLLAGFEGTLPSPAEAQNLAAWAARFGPGGSFWQGQSYPAGTAVTDIEFGNETSLDYQYSDNSPSAYASRAQTYALRFAEAATAIRAAAPGGGAARAGRLRRQRP